MQLTKPDVFTVDKILERQKKIDKQRVDLIWEQFVKWCYVQFQANRHINFGNVGNYGFKIEQKTNTKISFFFFNETFTSKNNLNIKIKTFVLNPVVKINYSMIAKNIITLNKKIKQEDIQKFVTLLLQFIEQSLKNKNDCFFVIDFDLMGKIVRKNNDIWFQHTLPHRKNSINGSSLRMQVNKQQGKLSTNVPLNKLSLLTSKQGFFPRIEKNESKINHKQKQLLKKDDIILQKLPNTQRSKAQEPQSIMRRKSSLVKFRKEDDRQSQQSILNSSNLKKRSSSLRSLPKNNLNSLQKPSQLSSKQSDTIGLQMMAAGSDPLKRKQTFSKLTSNLKSLMQNKFEFHQKEIVHNIPIIDMFSRTRSCPIAAQRQNPLICGRIGGNFNFDSQKLEIGEHGVEFKILNTEILSKEHSDDMMHVIDDNQEYRIVTREKRTTEDEHILSVLKTNYERFVKLFKLIPDDQIIPLSQQTLERISNILHFHGKDLSRLLEQILSQIHENYLYAIKKSVLDYILLDKVQRNRLSLYLKFKPVKRYGQVAKKQIVWQKFSFQNISGTIQSILLKNSKNVLKIVSQWNKNYANDDILAIPTTFTQYFTIDDFCDKRKMQMMKFKNKINEEWLPFLAQIYKDEISQLKRNTEKCQQFFQSTSTLLYIQIREKIMQTLRNYNDFIDQFNFEQINPPETAVHLQKTLGRYEKSFVTVRVSHRRQQIYFMDNMEEFLTKLLDIIELMRQLSHKVARPQNFITKSAKLYLACLNEDEYDFKQIKSSISLTIKRNIENTKKALQIYNKYRYILTESKRVDDWINESHDRRQYSLTLNKYRKLYDQVMEEVPFFIRVNMIYVDSNELKRYFLKCIQEMVQKIQHSVYALIMKKNAEIQSTLQNMVMVASSHAPTCQKLVEIESNVDNFKKNEIRKLQQKQQDLLKWISITLYSTFYPVTSQDLTRIYQTSQFLSTIPTKLNNQSVHIQYERSRLQSQVRKQSISLNDRSKILVKQIQQLKEFGGSIVKDSALELLKDCRRKITEYMSEKIILNRKEELLAMDQTELEKLLEWDRNLVHFEELWGLVDKFSVYHNSWSRENIFKQNAEFIQNQSKAMLKIALQLSNSSVIKHNAPLSLKVGQNLADEIKKFQSHIPLIAVFSNVGLKERHLKKIAQIINFTGDLAVLNSLTLQKVLGMNGNQFIGQLSILNDQVTRQYAVEQVLVKIKSDWQSINISTVKYKDTETNIMLMSSIQQIQNLLDQHLLKLLSVKGSIYAKIFESQLQQLEKWLNYTFELVQLSAKVQISWMYLQPVMNSSDILKHLSVQGSKFMTIDDQWKKITNFYCEKKLISEITKNKDIVKSLQNCQKNIEVVQKGLYSYFDSKRMSFPRFFFLSDDELLEILSQKKQVAGLQPYLQKCFEGIDRLQLQQNRYIVGIYSRKDQYVPFMSKINTTLARGNVDEILKEVEQKMFSNVRKQIQQCHGDYLSLDRKKCIFNRCQMAVLTVQMTHWTALVEQNILRNKIYQCLHKVEQSIKELIQILNTETLSENNLITLQSLITLYVHNLDVTKILAQKQTNKIDDFQWEAQLRYYYGSLEVFQQTKKTQVKLLTTYFMYNHEYLGNVQRLVLTPLTDRCYRTLCTAVEFGFGGLVQGPPGTGKTQTIKDLAKAFAFQCIVFNCSEGLDYRAMGKFFKGLAATGSWCCFDQFNKVNPQVLSVVAQQILSIQRAKSLDSPTVFFEEIQIKIKDTVNIFITMNPNQTEQHWLPDNLKSLLRPVSVIVPDYQKIMQVQLYSYGFKNPEFLAKKILNTYKLLEQLILPQIHYDYGLRALKSLLNLMKQMKKQGKKDEDQQVLTLKCILILNSSKFLANDLSLFEGIIKDIFPGRNIVQSESQKLLEDINTELKQRKLISSDQISGKILQIQEMAKIRSGVLIIGQILSGKSQYIQVLQTCLKHQLQIVKFYHKSVEIDKLYGSFDEVSRQWIDGLFSVHFKAMSLNQDDKKKWIILDGPVDSLWIQNLYSVLDDNRKLCLSSGQTISLNQKMTLMFESTSLQAASPAFITRCGVVYVHQKSIGHQGIIDSWMNRNSGLGKTIQKILKGFFCKLPSIYTQTMQYKPLIEFSQIYLTLSFLQIFQHHLLKSKQNINLSIKSKIQAGQYKESSKSNWDLQITNSQKDIFSIFGSNFVYSVLWSFGVSVDDKGRKALELFMKRLVISDFSRTKNQKITLPDKGSLFDYYFQIDSELSKLNGEWKRWHDKLRHQEFPLHIPAHDIMIKTKNIISHCYLISMLSSRNLPVVISGENGSGKSTLLNFYFKENLDEKLMGLLQITLSSNCKCQSLRNQIQQNFEKKGSKSVIGPKHAQSLILSVDDVNLPMRQKYGAQPPLQFLRQLLSENGFYDLKSRQKYFKKILATSFVFSMSSSRNNISQRFLRHSFFISLCQPDQDQITNIFTTILTTSFTGHSQQRNIKTLFKYCQQIYSYCKQKCLPIPTKIHYNFNLRDLWKLVVGICSADKQKIHSENIGRLWAHQTKRVFKDRLIEKDKPFIDEFVENISKKWGKNITDCYFTDLLSISPDISYQQVNDIEKINMSITASLKNYNMNTENPMDLVLFKYALQHILIVYRIIKQPKGHALLIGIGGCGKSSFASLASYAAQYKVFSFQSSKNYKFNEMKQQTKKMFLQIGLKGRQYTWVLHDRDMKNDEFLEYLNCFLKLGRVSNLFSQQEKIEICEKLRKQANQNLKGDMTLHRIFTYFQAKIQKLLRFVFCLSPVGESFYQLIKAYPSLVNCTSIDWYQQWPEQGLISVAKSYFSSIEIKHKDNYMKAIQYFHTSAKKWSEIYKFQTKCIHYVTPSSYLQFLNILRTLLTKKRKQVKEQIFKYSNGCKKIMEAEEKIEEMKFNLQAMKPKLKQAAQKTSLKLSELRLQKAEADMMNENVANEEKIVVQSIRQADLIKKECQNALNEALPELKMAEEALIVLDKNSLIELKSMTNPPPAVKLVFQGLCILIDPNPKQKIKNEKTFKMQTDWWAASLRNLGNPKLLQSLVNFNKQSISQKTMSTLGNFLKDPLNIEILKVENVSNSSTACECLIHWINGIYNLYNVNKSLQPKKAELKLAEQKIKQLNVTLDLKKQELEKSNKKVSQLTYELEWQQKMKSKIQAEYQQCELYLHRASIVADNLKEQKKRWYDQGQFYKKRQVKIDANVIIASAIVAYLGPYVQQYRDKIIDEWKNFLIKNHITLEQNISLKSFLGNSLIIREWALNGLAEADFYIDNAIIANNSKRWPLFIDPEGQANKWLQRQQASKKLKVIRLTEDNYIRNIENCIQFGTPIMIKNLQEQIPSQLNPIILKQTYRKGPTTYLRMGQNALIYSNDFFMYLTTRLRNPHYFPELLPQISLINFTITQDGLTSQLLSLIVKKQLPQLEQQKKNLSLQSSVNKKSLTELQAKILDVLNNTHNILSNQQTINVLATSKRHAREIQEKQQMLEETQATIDQSRSQYLTVAQEAATIFFVIKQLYTINSMYQYSLQYFVKVFLSSLKKDQRTTDVQSTLERFKSALKIKLYKSVSRGLYIKDRLAFLTLLTFKLERFSQQKIKFLLSMSQENSQKVVQKPQLNWLSQKSWRCIIALEKFSQFSNISKDFMYVQYAEKFKNFIESRQPFSVNLPPKYQFVSFKDKLLLYKSLRPEKTKQALQLLVNKCLGPQFDTEIGLDLDKVLKNSNYHTPILVLLSEGTDPYQMVYNYSKTKNIALENVSLGQGQGPIAERLIRQNLIKGGWVILQNCHLALSWMPNLIKLLQWLEQSQKQVNENFRIWLTSYPDKNFPQSILQKSIKIVTETSSSMKNNILNSFKKYSSVFKEMKNSVISQNTVSKYVFKLCLFHEILNQRKRFDANHLDVFNESDLKISAYEMKQWLQRVENGDKIMLGSLKYMIGQCFYGGKVTNLQDKSIILSLFDAVINESNQSKTSRNKFVPPQSINSYDDYLKFIEQLPDQSEPLVLEFNQNALIKKDSYQTQLLLESLSLCYVNSPYNTKQVDQSVQNEILSKIEQVLNCQRFPQQFDLQMIQRKYPIKYQQCLNFVLIQQVSSYNVLIRTIKQSLQELAQALKGEITITDQLEQLYKSISSGKVPGVWLRYSYLSLKNFRNYLNDLSNRIQFFRKWAKMGTPQTFWLGAFFYVQSFLTAVKLNYARKYNLPIEKIQFDYEYDDDKFMNYHGGVIISGLYLEGASWNKGKMVLQQPNYGYLCGPGPQILLKPTLINQIKVFNSYECPLYRIPSDCWQKTQSFNQSNLLATFNLPSEENSSHWILRNVCFLTELND